MIFEQRPKADESESHVAVQGMNIPGSVSGQCKGPGVGGGLACWWGCNELKGRMEDTEQGKG